MKKTLLFILVGLFVLSALAGCAAAPRDESYYSGDAGDAEYAPQPVTEESEDMAMEDAAGPDGGLNYDQSLLQPGVSRKIIYHGDFYIRTRDFDADYDRLMNMLDEVDGYIESSTVSGTKPTDWRDEGRTARLNLRVPSSEFYSFVGQIEAIGETTAKSIAGTDISLEYFDTETRLKTLRTRQERLLALLEEAATLEDIVELERELADVSYEIQSYETQLRDYDSLINYSTISIEMQEINEVEKVTASDESLGGRISRTFFSVVNALADFGEFVLVLLIGGAPVILPLAAIIVVVIVLVRRKKKRQLK